LGLRPAPNRLFQMPLCTLLSLLDLSMCFFFHNLGLAPPCVHSGPYQLGSPRPPQSSSPQHDVPTVPLTHNGGFPYSPRIRKRLLITRRSSSGNRLLMERIRPGTSLCDQVVSGRPRPESIVIPASPRFGLKTINTTRIDLRGRVTDCNSRGGFPDEKLMLAGEIEVE